MLIFSVDGRVSFYDCGAIQMTSCSLKDPCSTNSFLSSEPSLSFSRRGEDRMNYVDKKELSFVIKIFLMWSFPAPLVAPANVTGHNTSSTSIHVTWQAVSPNDVNIRGIHRGYNIFYVPRDTPRPSVLMNVTVDALTTHVQLTNLYKFTKYDIQVTVRTRWDGPKSTSITVSTDEGSK